MVYLALRYLQLNRPAEARRYTDQALARDSSFFMAHWMAGRLHLAAGEYDAALRAFARPGTDLGGMSQQALIGYTLARARRGAEARAVPPSALLRTNGKLTPGSLSVL